MASNFKIPGGDDKGTPIDEAGSDRLEFWIKRIKTNLEADPGKQYADKDRAWISAAETELKRRAGGGAPTAPGSSPVAPPPAQRSQSSAQGAVQLYSGAHDDAREATEALAKLQEVGHLVSPAPACGTLPAGTAIVISTVVVDSANETFGLPDGKRGLGKVPLCKIAGALGVSWSPESGRLDDGSDNRFVHYRAVGYIREFDGTMRTIVGEKIMDLRPGSAQCEAHEKRANDKAKRENKPAGDWESQIRDMRLFILEHAETKARLRAVRLLGLRSSYSEADLKKPFFAAKLQFTGHSDDPEIRRMFAARIADSMLGSVSQLYGHAQPTPQARQVQQAQPGYSPPPVARTVTTDGEVIDDDMDRGNDPNDY